MECRKARYCLVASFDEPLTAEDGKNLSYHLKDCSACRHEAFYYRELFSAEKQVPERTPGADFNERLVAELRLREARSAWPESHPAPARRFRWSLVYVPALFATTAALGFFAFLPGRTGDVSNSPVTSPTPQTASAPVQAEPARLRDQAYPESQPRYIISVRHGERSQDVMFYIPGSLKPSLTNYDDPFRSTLVPATRPLQTVRSREQERYVLPVVTQASERERIY